ncbi:hypothetical protein [Amycolatopsis tolypomycina]|uniref:hypothetical protein n=1 Tax=Amycolatopsis tolypomycina TaxID=208445 RepID=UPI0033BAC0ED
MAGTEADELGQAVVPVDAGAGVIGGLTVGSGSPVPQATGSIRPAEQAKILAVREKPDRRMVFLLSDFGAGAFRCGVARAGAGESVSR